jgi:NodT family efflux transporter outer membrane factor (OMF) lipoprotein
MAMANRFPSGKKMLLAISTLIGRGDDDARSSRIGGAASLLAIVALSGCTVGPEPRAPSAASLHLPGDFHAPSSDAADQAELAQWWASFNDPVLASLVQRAITGNNNLAAAQARLRAARAALDAAQGARLPQVNSSASLSRQEAIEGNGFSGTNFQAGLDASWEADIFGRLTRTAQAARATAEGSAATLADVRRSLVAEVALAYLDLRQTQARLAVARENLGIQDNTLEIVGWKAQAGTASDLEVQQATAQRAQTAAGIPALEQTLNNDMNQIAVLLGQNPGSLHDELAAPGAIPIGPDAVEAGLPADLLNRRPDLMASAKSLEAETARIGVAQAQLYPALRLSGSLTTSSARLADLGESIMGSLLGSISAPIFQGGQIRARIAQQTATADAALASYRQAVLTALSDVENALVAVDRSKAREIQLGIAEDAARESVRLATARYQAGLIDFQTLLNSQASLLNTQDSHTVSRANRASAAIQLYKALGGGWDVPATAAASAPAQTGSK